MNWEIRYGSKIKNYFSSSKFQECFIWYGMIKINTNAWLFSLHTDIKNFHHHSICCKNAAFHLLYTALNRISSCNSTIKVIQQGTALLREMHASLNWKHSNLWFSVLASNKPLNLLLCCYNCRLDPNSLNIKIHSSPSSVSVPPNKD